MAARVFLHVGAMKSATTYLQALCRVNEDALREQGVFWPGGQANFRATQDFFAGPGRRDNHGAWADLQRRIGAAPEAALVSNELLLRRSKRDLKRLVEAFAPAEVTVIITCRDLARVLPSQWQTSIRTGSTTRWADYAEAVLRGPDTTETEAAKFWRQHNLPEAAARCADLAADVGVTVVTVPPPGSDPDVMGTRFLEAIGASAEGLQQPLYRNTSLGAHSAELGRRINEQLEGWGQAERRAALRMTLFSSVLEARSAREPRFGLSPSQWDAAHALAEQSVTGLRRLDLTVVGDLDDLVPRDRPQQPLADPEQSTTDELLTTAVAGLIGLSKQYAILQAGHAPPVEPGNADPSTKSTTGFRDLVLLSAFRGGRFVRRRIKAVPGASRVTAFARRSRRRLMPD